MNKVKDRLAVWIYHLKTTTKLKGKHWMHTCKQFVTHPVREVKTYMVKEELTHLQQLLDE